MNGHASVLQSRFHYLVTKLDTNSSTTTLLSELSASDVISVDERQRIMNLDDPFCRNEWLVLLLMGKPKSKYGLFLNALRKCHQEHVEQMLTFEPGEGGQESADQTDSDHHLSGVSGLHEKVLRCHQMILKKVDSREVRCKLFQYGLFLCRDYKTLIPDGEHNDQRGQCESMMYLLYNAKPPEKVESNLRHFLRILEESERGKELVLEILSVDLCQLECVKRLSMPTGVRGVSVIDNTLYVTLDRCSSLRSFSVTTGDDYKHLHCISVTGLGWPSDMVADQVAHLLFITERFGQLAGVVQACQMTDDLNHQIYLAAPEVVNYPGIFTVALKTKALHFCSFEGDTPAGLSLTSDGKLVVTFEHKEKQGRSVRIFTTSDGIIKCISNVDLSGLERYLLQATLFHRDTEPVFAISQLHKKSNLHRICLVDKNGKVSTAYGGSKKGRWPQFRSPWAVMADSRGHLLITNCHFHKIQVLDQELNYCRDLWSQNDDPEFKCPRCLYVDEQNSLMYIGQRWKASDQMGSHSASFGAVSVVRQSSPSRFPVTVVGEP